MCKFVTKPLICESYKTVKVTVTADLEATAFYTNGKVISFVASVNVTMTAKKRHGSIRKQHECIFTKSKQKYSIIHI